MIDGPPPRPEAQTKRARFATRPTDVNSGDGGDWAKEGAASVIICSHSLDRWDWLRAAVRSTARQTVAVEKTVVVIDGNRDLAKLAVEQLSDVCTVVARDGCGGLSEARNSGLAVVTTPFVAFLDDDAEAEEHWLERLLEPLADPQVLGVGGRSVPLWERAEPAWFPPELLWVVGCSYPGLPTEVAPVRNVFGGCAVYRRELFGLYGGFRSDLGRHLNDAAGCEETEFCLRASSREAHGTFVYHPSAVIHHHVPSSRTTVSYIAKRSFAEGRSKALLVAHTRYDTARPRLETETDYALRVLTQAFVINLRSAIRGDSSGLSRSAVLAISVLAAACGFMSSFVMSRGRGDNGDR